MTSIPVQSDNYNLWTLHDIVIQINSGREIVLTMYKKWAQLPPCPPVISVHVNLSTHLCNVQSDQHITSEGQVII